LVEILEILFSLLGNGNAKSIKEILLLIIKIIIRGKTPLSEKIKPMSFR